MQDAQVISLNYEQQLCKAPHEVVTWAHSALVFQLLKWMPEEMLAESDKLVAGDLMQRMTDAATLKGSGTCAWSFPSAI